MSWARGASIAMGRDKHHPRPPSCQADRYVVRGPWRVVTSSSVSTHLPHSPVPGLWTDERIRAAYSEGAGIYRIVPRGGAAAGGGGARRQLGRRAGGEGPPLVARGGGSGMAGGSVGRGVIVDLSQGFGWTKANWERRHIWVGASVTWAQVNGAARQFGLRLPPDPASGAFATSGGLVATNAAGPRSVRCGSVRQWVEALEAVGAGGAIRRVSRGGGPGRWRLDPASSDLVRARFPRTRKNSGGYALDRFAESGDELDLLIGSEGTLGFITAVQWRLEPIPPDVAGAVLGFATLDALVGALPYLVALNPSAVELLDRTFLALVEQAGAVLPSGLAAVLLLEFERDTAAAARGVVSDAVRGLKSVTAHVETALDRSGLERLWAIRKLASPVLARLSETRRSLQVVEDGCVPQERLGAYVEGIRAAAERRDLAVAMFGHAGGGHVHVNALPDTSRPGWRDAVAGRFTGAGGLFVGAGGTPSGGPRRGRPRGGPAGAFFGAAGRGLFRAPQRTTAEYLENIKKQGHGSVLEHSVYVLLIEGISRSCSHELVRHRAGFGYSQISQRYVDESHAAFVMPPAIVGDATLEAEWEQQVAAAQAAYVRGVAGLMERYAGVADKVHRRKMAREAARSVLPNATEVKIVVSGNARAWRTMLELRTSEGAELEIRGMAIACLRVLQREAPALFCDFEVYVADDRHDAARVAYHKV